MQEAVEGYVDLSDDDPEIIARLIAFMYFGQHPHDMGGTTACAFEASLATLLTRPERDVVESTLPLEASLVTAADKFQMPATFVNACKTAYIDRIQAHWSTCLSGPIALELIDSLRIIYQAPPSAGLRGRAITMTQYNMGELQHRGDFQQLLLATPELALDLAAKGYHQRVWCRACSAYTVFIHYSEPVGDVTQCTQVWDLIDYGRPLDLGDVECQLCCMVGDCTAHKPDADDKNV